MDSMSAPAVSLQIEGGETVVIDQEDEARVRSLRWRVVKTGGKSGSRTGCYVMACGKQSLYLHRFLMGEPKDKIVDHIDRDTLNCRKANLRAVDRRVSNRNRASFPGSTSKYKGVCWDKKSAQWVATIHADGITYRLGLFRDDQLAAAIYDDASAVLHGEQGFRNFPDRTPQPITLKAPGPKGEHWHRAALGGEKFTFEL